MGVVHLSDAMNAEKSFVPVADEAIISTHNLVKPVFDGQKKTVIEKESENPEFKKALEDESRKIAEDEDDAKEIADTFEEIMSKKPDEIRAMAEKYGINADRYTRRDTLVRAIIKKRDSAEE